MSEHILKTDSDVFEAVITGKKTYEIRFNDRNYQVGDTLILRETKYTGREMALDNKPLKYTGRAHRSAVSHVLNGPTYGLADGWVILSLDSDDRAELKAAETERDTAQRMLDLANKHLEQVGSAARFTGKMIKIPIDALVFGDTAETLEQNWDDEPAYSQKQWDELTARAEQAETKLQQQFDNHVKECLDCDKLELAALEALNTELANRQKVKNDALELIKSCKGIPCFEEWDAIYKAVDNALAGAGGGNR